MRLAFFIRSLYRAGSERQLVNLAVGLRERGHDVSVYVSYGGGELEDELTDAGVAVYSFQKRGRWDLAGFAVRWAGAIMRGRYDIVYTFLPSENLLGALFKSLMRRTKLCWGVLRVCGS